MNRVRAFAPASIGNVGSGFDVFGLAVEQPGDYVTVERRDAPGVVMASITGDDGRLPYEAERNTASVAVRALLRHLERADVGIAVHLDKRLPLGSGLGSSGASSVAAVHAANVLLGEPLAKRALLPFAMEAEAVACGAPHADNVAPSLLGGFVLVRASDPLDLVEIPTPPELWCALVHPHLEVRTEDARGVLPTAVPLATAVQQWANTAGLVAGMLQGDYELIGRSVEDLVAEPARAPLVPGFAAVKRAATDAGALGSSLSGSGPTVFALCRGEAAATRVGAAMAAAFADAGHASDTHLSRANPRGACTIEDDALPQHA